MIINPTEYNENGLWWIKLVNLSMKDKHKYVVQVSWDQSGGKGCKVKSSLLLTGGGGGEGRGPKSADEILEQSLMLDNIVVEGWQLRVTVIIYFLYSSFLAIKQS